MKTVERSGKPKAIAAKESRTRLFGAALNVIRAKGFTATRVEDICEGAGLTKGSFFHHFSSKEDLAVAAAEYWGSTTSGLFASAEYHTLADPLDRLLAYIDLRKTLLRGDLPDFTCFAGTTVQEVYVMHPVIRDAAGQTILDHAATLQPDIAEAMRKYGIRGSWTASSLALYTQAVIQGAFVLAKAKEGPAIAATCLDHLRRYVEMLFERPASAGSDLMRLQSDELMRLQLEEQDESEF
jgi:TetR/AcrR family transcriptional repressor of nem operon